ncbi:MAG: radical SAM protein [Bacteroidales bacterium]
MQEHDIVFGPIPSRRLGRSLGINNIPPKICSYSCVYCQVGRSIKMDYQRKAYYSPEEIFHEVEKKVRETLRENEKIDYLTFVPDGEATLDINLGKEIEKLKELGVKQAIITNSSLIDRKDVQNDLKSLDLVSVKIDSVLPAIWKRIDRPHKMLDLNKIKSGIRQFADEYQGKLITETMLIDGINDTEENMKAVADFIAGINPAVAYISIPTRPPARKNVKPAGEKQVNKAFQIFSEKIERVEMLIGHEGNAFAHSGDTKKDILSITAVHPMRDDTMQEFLEKDNEDWSVIEQLIGEGKLLETEFGGHKFYLRKFTDRQRI